MTLQEIEKETDDIMSSLEAKLKEIWKIIDKADDFGIAIPKQCLWMAEKTPKKWWQSRKSEFLSKAQKQITYDNVLKKLTKEEIKILGL